MTAHTQTSSVHFGGRRRLSLGAACHVVTRIGRAP